MWITLTEADLLTVLSGPELQAYRAEALAAGQPDPVAPTLAQVTEDLRGYVAACPRNELGALGTIPSRLKITALDLIAVRLPGRLGRGPKPVRKDAALKAEERLRDVAAGKFMVDQPDLVSFELESAPSPYFMRRRPRGHWGALHGREF